MNLSQARAARVRDGGTAGRGREGGAWWRTRFRGRKVAIEDAIERLHSGREPAQPVQGVGLAIGRRGSEG